MAPNPTVSVVVPAYNAARHIAECLESIQKQNAEVPFEVIVVDDGSTDDTRERVARFPDVRLLRQENAGPSAARNHGIREARGQYVAFLDSDDLWTPDKLRVQMAVFEAHPEAALVFGDCRRFTDGGAMSETFFEESGYSAEFTGEHGLVAEPYVRLFRGNYIPTGSVILRKSCLDETGMFDERRRYVEDLELWLRVALSFPLAYTTVVCQLKRQHQACVSNDTEKMTLAHFEILDEHRKVHGDLLRRHGVNLGPRYALGYSLLGDEAERQGRIADARRWYRKGFSVYPSIRPLYYLARTFWRRY